jgi:hypothetical protein
MNLLLISLVHAQILNEGSFLVPTPGARAAAMGDAGVADISNVTMMYWNPGALPFLEHISVIVDHYAEAHTRLMNDVVATTVWRNDENALTVGAAFGHLGYLTTAEVPSMQVIQTGLSLAYARLLAPGLSAGVTATAVYIDIAQDRRWSNTWKAGLMYHPSPEISYGIVFSDELFGAQLQRSSVAVKEQLPRRLEIGLSVRVPVSRDEHRVTLSLANEKIFGEAGLLYKGGLEVCPFKFLALRWGYLAGLNVALARYGAGIRTDVVQLDYAISPSLNDVQFQQLTLSIIFH